MVKHRSPIPVEVSARHIHVSESDWRTLFGAASMTVDHPISLPGQFVAKERVVLRGPKSEFKNVGVVGPFRPYTQVELSMTESRTLGIAPPLSDSGKLDGAASVTIIGPSGEITPNAAIVQQRHLHCSPDDAKKLGVRNGQIVSMHIAGKRSATLHEALVRVDPAFTLRLHLDTDEGNACAVKPGMIAELVD